MRNSFQLVSCKSIIEHIKRVVDVIPREKMLLRWMCRRCLFIRNSFYGQWLLDCNRYKNEKCYQGPFMWQKLCGFHGTKTKVKQVQQNKWKTKHLSPQFFHSFWHDKIILASARATWHIMQTCLGYVKWAWCHLNGPGPSKDAVVVPL